MSPLSHIFEKVRSTIRYKLLVLVLFPIVLALPAALFIAVDWGRQFGYDQLFIKVNTDLSVARDAFTRIQTDYLDAAGRLAESFQFHNDLQRQDSAAISQRVSDLRDSAGFSYLHLIGPEGDRLYESKPGRHRPSTLIDRAMAGEAVNQVEIFSSADLANDDLAAQVRLPLIATPLAVPTDKTTEDRGMMIRVAYPVRDASSKVIGVLDGGILLNGNFKFVDAIRDLVYGEGSLPAGSIGTVTVFLDDVRISTNVPLGPGERALGTRVSQVVRNQVLSQGQTWIDRAFVVNDWYISGYQPIVDGDGQRVGMLYAGFLEEPFRQQLWRALGVLALFFVLLMTLSAVLAVQGAKSIFRPVEAMARVVAATRRGEEKRIGNIPSRDEIGELARGVDAMLDLLQQRADQIQQAADELELKVELRTAELKQRNAELSSTIDVLRETRRALVEAEKLAALGELTAGVAHEINNPTAVILGNVDVVVQELGEQLDPVRDEFRLIVQQIYRIREIVERLLQYARPVEYAGYVSETDVNDVMGDTVKLIHHMLKDTDICVQTHLMATLKIEINSQELQQVLVNLMVNAVHAVDTSTGQIEISCEDWDDRGVLLTVNDNGRGIATADLDKIFNPFFGTKHQGEGTGLGLSISYGIVRRYGGRITVASRIGEGTQFSVWLLCKPEYEEDEAMIADQLSKIIEQQARQRSA